MLKYQKILMFFWSSTKLLYRVGPIVFSKGKKTKFSRGDQFFPGGGGLATCDFTVSCPLSPLWIHLSGTVPLLALSLLAATFVSANPPKQFVPERFFEKVNFEEKNQK